MNTIKVTYKCYTADEAYTQKFVGSMIQSPFKNFTWDKEDKSIFIRWEYGQEDELKDVLTLCEKLFDGVSVSICNEEIDDSPSNSNEESRVDNKENSDKTISDQKETTEIPETNKSEDTCETIVVDSGNMNVESDKTDIVEDVSKEAKAPPPTSSDIEEEPEEDYGEALKELFSEDLEIIKASLKEGIPKYCSSIDAFCKKFGIKNENLVYSIKLVVSIPNRERLIKELTRLAKKNVALVKIDLKKSFETFMIRNYPDFMKVNPKVNVMDFLNIFREDGSKI